MKKENHDVVIWVGGDQPEVRRDIATVIQDALDDAFRNSEVPTRPAHEASHTFVFDTPLRESSLKDIMSEMYPQFFDSSATETERNLHLGQALGHFAGTANDYAERIVKANTLIINGANTDGSHHKQWYLDRALRVLNGSGYSALIEQIKQQDIADGVIDKEDADQWEWNQGIAP